MLFRVEAKGHSHMQSILETSMSFEILCYSKSFPILTPLFNPTHTPKSSCSPNNAHLSLQPLYRQLLEKNRAIEALELRIERMIIDTQNDVSLL